MPTIAVAPARHLDDYLASLSSAGAKVRLLVDPHEDAKALISDPEIGGVLLLGGGDVHPSLYGDTPHPTFDPAEEGRDAFEIALTRAAAARDIPFLAICRGIQVMNVAFGGTLVQDIPSEIPAPLPHRIKENKQALAHEIDVVPGSRLQKILGSTLNPQARCHVNSRHHQSVKQVGNGLRTCAVAADGVIEAIEHPAKRFFVGVQWHPENFWQTGRFATLFNAFVTAAAQPAEP